MCFTCVQSTQKKDSGPLRQEPWKKRAFPSCHSLPRALPSTERALVVHAGHDGRCGFSGSSTARILRHIAATVAWICSRAKIPAVRISTIAISDASAADPIVVSSARRGACVEAVSFVAVSIRTTI